MQFSAKVFTAFRLKLIRKRKQSVAGPSFREAVKPPQAVSRQRSWGNAAAIDGLVGPDRRDGRERNGSL